MRCLYLVGGPGVGKSALMDGLTVGYQRMEVGQPRSGLRPRREMLIKVRNGRADEHFSAVELGARAGKHPAGFPGTDALSMSAIVDVEEWIVSGIAAHEAEWLLAEGARLANRRFVEALRQAGIGLDVVLVEAELAERRRTHRGSNQKPSWVAGAFTRARRFHEYVTELAESDESVHVHTLSNDVGLRHGIQVLRDITGL